MLLASLLPASGRAQITLSDSARISLLTCSPGHDELYSIFGHTGIRVTDYKQGFDVVFNYGTFNFNRPGFYLNFCRGLLYFMVAIDRFDDFRGQYIYEQRSIYEQELLLSTASKQQMFAFLLNNTQPENCEYNYDFLFDNCATRVRDVFEKYSGHNFKTDYSAFPQKSFRDLIDDYSAAHPWYQFGMGILIGLPVDRQATPREQCFLPDYLSEAVAHTTVEGHPLAKPRQLILDAPASPETSFAVTPNMVFIGLLLLALMITWLEWQRQTHFRWFDLLLFTAAGLIGTLYVVLLTLTQHKTPAWNLNFFWAWPTHWFFVWFKPKGSKRMAQYFQMAALSAGFMALFGWMMPQHFMAANWFIAATIAVRAFQLGRYHQSKQP